jgi:predicted outer membrane repeat protein
MRKLYYSLISLLFILFLTQELYALDVSGSVITNTTWGPEQVNVTDDVTISASVTIAAGTRIVVADQTMITVTSAGSIQANGVSGSEIVFTAENPATGWRGIFFDSGTGDDLSSSFEYTTFEYGNADGSSASTNAGGAVSISYHSDILFVNCHFEYNQAATYGGAINSAYSQLILENCMFKSNQAEGSGGGAVHITNSDGKVLRIENCEFYNNYAYTGGAIQAEFAGGLNVSGSVFANNESNSGGAVTLGQSSSNDISFVSNTFVNNLANNSSGAVVNVTAFTEGLSFINNIVFGNENGSGEAMAINFGNQPYTPVFQNCLIEGGQSSVSGLPGSVTWLDIIDEAPGFVLASSGVGNSFDGSSADWQLSDQSPCINAGLEDVSGLGLPDYDLAGNPRIQQERIDMGALESSFVPTSIVNRLDNVDFKLWYRRDSEQIVVQTEDHEYFTGALYNITGALVEDKRPASFQNQMIFSAAGLNRGIYVVTLFRSDGKALKVSKVLVN